MTEMTLLRDGTQVADPRLDRLKQFDERSRAFPIMETVGAAKKPRSYTWRILGGAGAVLDQGREGACVGFAWTAELRARPREYAFDNAFAQTLYKEAQTIDPWPGEAYSGTSVLAGVQILQRRKLIQEYRWAFGIDEVIMGVGYGGPAVLGIPWYDGMYRTQGDWLKVSGSVVGGHAILARAVSLKKEAILLRNSWGADWGNAGDAWISFSDLEMLLQQQGECCIPVGRL